MFFFNKQTSVVGIDIGTSSVKAVQIQHGANGPVLESYGMVNVYYPNEHAGKIDVIKQTAKILGALYEKAGFTSKKVVLSLPSNIAFVSVLNFPVMSEKEMQKSVEYQAKKYIPLPLGDVNLGWKVLTGKGVSNTQAAGEVAKMKVLLNAVPKSVINNYERVVSLAGFQASALEIESLSLIRSLMRHDDRETSLIVDIGAKMTTLSLVSYGNLAGSRHIPVGGESVTIALAQSMGISYERAEQMKRDSLKDPSQQSAIEVTRGVLGVVKDEVQQMARIAEGDSKKISKIILTGGGSKLPGIIEQFSNFAPNVDYGNPFSFIKYPDELGPLIPSLSLQLAVAIGLALRPDS